MVALLLSVMLQAAAGPAPLAGRVVDASGAPVAGARIEVFSRESILHTSRSADDGTFTVPALENGVLRVSAAGFADERLPLDGAAREIRVVLQPAPLTEIVTVTASRGAGGADPLVSASVVTATELMSGGAGSIDDALRSVPGFTLFRRSSSRVANPTAQGAALRGLSGSGASRTIALADGVLLNDAFGGWIYWNRVPLAAIERIEVVRGNAGDLYGPDAAGGVIQILTFAPDRPRLRASIEWGSFDTWRASVFGAGSLRGVSGSIAAEAFDTDGYRIVAEPDRGPVDTPASSGHRTVTVRAGGRRAGGLYVDGWAAVFSEDRENGTPLQVNDTDARQVGGGGGGPAGGGLWQVRLSGGTQGYDQSFSTIAADRRSESLNRLQRVPSSYVSGSATWTRPWRSQYLLFGVEGRRVEGTTIERAFARDVVVSTFEAGGTQRTLAAFGRLALEAGDRTTIAIGARADLWRSEIEGPDRRSSHLGFIVPRVAVAFRASPSVALGGAVYQAFRAPTLNELVRGFRVGSVVTLANPSLEPEELTALEGSATVARGPLSARITGYWSQLADSIANVTLSVTPSLITRQRRNAGAIRASGLEIEADVRPWRELALTAAAAFSRSRFHDAAEPAIEGNRVPQVPLYQISLGARYTNSRRALTFTGQLRLSGSQYDDDRNELPLGRAAIVDVLAMKTLARGVHAFVAVENLFDMEYAVGRTPLRTIGAPLGARAGLRVFVP
jgi:outer membrane cobalamin receptor